MVQETLTHVSNIRRYRRQKSKMAVLPVAVKVTDQGQGHMSWVNGKVTGHGSRNDVDTSRRFVVDLGTTSIIRRSRR